MNHLLTKLVLVVVMTSNKNPNQDSGKQQIWAPIDLLEQARTLLWMSFASYCLEN